MLNFRDRSLRIISTVLERLHLLTHVRMAKIVIKFTPIVKDFSPKLRKKANFSEKTDKYTTRKSKYYQMVLFLNEATLSGEKTGERKSRGKIKSGKNLVTCEKFSHFSPTTTSSLQ